MLVRLENLPAEKLRAVLEALHELAGQPPPETEARLIGLPVLNRALDASADEISRKYFPGLVAFAIVILWLCFRTAGGVLKPLLFVAFCELALLGGMSLLGVKLNLVLVILPPLVFVIALATALHLLFRLRRHTGAGLGVEEACLTTYREKGWSVLWTGITTVIGFSSLALSPVGPIRSLGIWAGVALSVMTLAAFSLYPALLVSGGVPRRSRQGGFELWSRVAGRRWAEWSCRHRRGVLAVAALLSLAALAALPRIRIESNALRYFPPEHPVRADLEQVEELGFGLAVAELLLTAPPETEGFESAGSLMRLATLTERLQQEELVLGALSAGSIVHDAVRRSPAPPLLGPAGHWRLVYRGFQEDTEGRGALDGRLADEGRLARMTLFVRTVGYEELDELSARIRVATREAFPEVGIEITGEYPLLVESQRRFLSTLVVSISLTLVLVAIIFRLLLTGGRLTVLALLPNLWPVIGVFGIMGWTGIPLDIATVMVASIVLGLAVDDTIHTLGHFRRLAPRLGARAAVAETLERTAPAYLVTGLILAAGFGACSLSSFAPTANFGMLSAAAITLAVLGDLFLLPALLSYARVEAKE